MNTKSLLTRTVVVFAALALAGLGLALSARFTAEALDQTTLVAVGSALFGAALCFFLVRVFSITEK